MTDSNSPTSEPEARLNRPPRVCISTADHSGDAVGARLAKALLKRGPVELFGAGGSAMREAGVEILSESTKYAVLGIVGWLPNLLPGVFANWRARWVIRKRRPDLLVCIDSGGFNVAIARTLRCLGGQKVLYYIPPRSWSRKWRVKPLREADYVAAPFPWNVDGDDGTGRVRFVGHPAADLPALMPPPAEMRERLGLDPRAPTVALLPGSRKLEVRCNVPALLETYERMRSRIPDLQAVLSRSHSARKRSFEARVARTSVDGVKTVEGAAPALRAADVALVCMGTATVEACALGVPMVSYYRGTPYQAIEYYIRPKITEFFALPNILAGEKIIDEFIGPEASRERLADTALELLEDHAKAAAMRARLNAVTELLGGPGAAERAADAVHDALNDTWRAGDDAPAEARAAAS